MVERLGDIDKASAHSETMGMATGRICEGVHCLSCNCLGCGDRFADVWSRRPVVVFALSSIVRRLGMETEAVV